MEQVDNAAGRVLQTDSTTSTTSGSGAQLPEPDLKRMTGIWLRMNGEFGWKWSKQNGEKATRDDGSGGSRLTTTARMWWASLYDLTPEQIQRGLMEVGRLPPNDRGEVWPPNAPEFRAMCLDVQSGLPPVDRAYHEACEGSGRPAEYSWSHPAVYVAARDAGFWSLRREPSRTTWPAFRRAYEDACRRVQAGEDLSGEVMAALPKTPGHVEPLDRDTARSRLDGMRAALRGRQDPADAAAEWERLNAPRGQLQRPNNDCAEGEGTA